MSSMFKGKQRCAFKIYISTFLWVALLQTLLKSNVELHLMPQNFYVIGENKHRIDAIRKELEKKSFDTCISQIILVKKRVNNI